MAMAWDIATVRSRLRLYSGLVMLAFVVCHLAAHVFLLVSLERGDAALTFLMWPWRTIPGTVLLAGAFVVHYVNALWSIYTRRSLRVPRMRVRPEQYPTFASFCQAVDAAEAKELLVRLR